MLDQKNRFHCQISTSSFKLPNFRFSKNFYRAQSTEHRAKHGEQKHCRMLQNVERSVYLCEFQIIPRDRCSNLLSSIVVQQSTP